MCTSFFDGDMIYRHRAMGMIGALWRAMLPFFSMRVRDCLLILPILSVVEVAATCASMSFFDEKGAIRCSVTLSVLSLSTVGWCYGTVYMFHAQYQMQQRISLEQEASQSILSMVCDATFWLAADGDTLLHGSPHLDALLSADSKGSRFSSYLADTEQDRFKMILGAGGQHVHLLPTTLQNAKSSSRIGVDLFIVDRKQMQETRSDGNESPLPSKSYGFFVGLRLSAATELSTVCGAPVGCPTSVSSGNVPLLPNTCKTLSERTLSNSSGASSASLSKLPNTDRISIEFDPLSSEMTGITFHLSSKKNSSKQLQRCLLQPSFESFYSWLCPQVNDMLSGKSMTCPQLGPVLLTIPPLANGLKALTLSASIACLEEDDVINYAEEDYPLVTLVLDGVQEVVKRRHHRHVDAMPSISEMRHRHPRTG